MKYGIQRQRHQSKEAAIVAEVKAIYAELGAGTTRAVVAQRLGCHLDTAGKYMRKAGVDTIGVDLQTRQDEAARRAEEVRRLHADGQLDTWEDICAMYGCHKTTATNYIKAAGIDPCELSKKRGWAFDGERRKCPKCGAMRELEADRDGTEMCNPCMEMKYSRYWGSDLPELDDADRASIAEHAAQVLRSITSEQRA